MDGTRIIGIHLSIQYIEWCSVNINDIMSDINQLICVDCQYVTNMHDICSSYYDIV